MQIQKSWSSFRIILLLYIMVLILPFGFYSVYKSFKTMQNDTKIVRLTSWTGGAIEHIASDTSDQNNKQMILKVNTALQNISEWVVQNNTSELYIGATNLSEDFSKVQLCWNTYMQKLSEQKDTSIKQHALHCYNVVENLAIIVEKMVYLKQNKLINIFYLSLIVLMLLLLLTIYMIRIYIYTQMKKHAIYDHETKLFNKTYFLAELKTSCARSVRNNYPLSIMSISIDENKEGNKKSRKHILGMFGGLITSLTRISDVACRYDENHFYILLPDTQEENALILEKRIHEALEKHDFYTTPKPNFKFAVTHFNYKESPEAFIIRAKELLN